MSIVVMGVTGCGKTTVGRYLASELDYPFHDGDDFHPAANVRKMKSGTPLTDPDRARWLQQLGSVIRDADASGSPVVVACSALKSSYRRRLRADAERNSPLFVYLSISFDVAMARVRSRPNHYMPASLVQSQFDTLEQPNEAIVVDADQPLHEVEQAALREVRAALNP